MQGIQGSKNNLQHVLDWKETPESGVLTLAAYDDFIGKAGEKAAVLDEQCAGIKGSLQLAWLESPSDRNPALGK